MLAFAHYLESKRSVDDRALNRRVLDRLRAELETVERPAIADVGAGIGTGIERLAAWQLVGESRYTAVEKDPALLAVARDRLHERFDAELVAAALDEFAGEPANRDRFHLVVAHAVLDILELAPALKDLVALARPGGLVYLPICYDGETILFEPAHQDDEAVLAAYHRAMDANGESKTGRKLFHALEREPVEILEVGASDWIVTPAGDGYPHDEGFFLDCILGMVEQTVGESARDWAATRRRQREEARLLYVAHQLDYLVRKRS